MEQIFLQMEWTNAVQLRFFNEFKPATKDNTKYINFLDFYNHWRERLHDVDVGHNYIIEYFRNNLPTRVQLLVDLNKVKKLEQFHAIIQAIPESDLVWHDLSEAHTLEKREALLDQEKAKKNGQAGASTPKAETENPKKSYTKYNSYKKAPEVNYICAHCSCQSNSSSPGSNPGKDDEQLEN